MTDTDWWARQHAPRFTAIVDALPSTPDSVLLVGAAPYTLAAQVADATSTASHYGINLGDGAEYEYALDETTLTIRECNVETDAWPFDTDSMDVVVMGAILEHLFDPAAALSEAWRVCHPDGHLVLSTPNATRLIQRARMLAGHNPFDGFDSESKYHRHNHEWTRGELYDICAATGWEVATFETVTLRRRGALGRLYELAAGAYAGWDDQLVLTATPTAARGETALYRESVVARGDMDASPGVPAAGGGDAER